MSDRGAMITLFGPVLCVLFSGCANEQSTARSTASTATHPGPQAATTAPPAGSATVAALTHAPATPQRAGDAARGRDVLLNENYIGCGMPESLYLRGQFPASALKGRSAQNRDLPFYLTRFRNHEGVKTITANCLGCHAAYLNGSLVIGLGATVIDFGIDPRVPMALGRSLVQEPAERREYEKLRSRIEALYPSVLMSTIGANPGDHIAAVLMSHRDPTTLAWSDKPLFKPPTHKPYPVDVPAWWLMKKKNAMFFTAAGRGDHARMMMSASALCTDNVDEAKRIDEMFPDVRAFISSLSAPRYPFKIDSDLASKGKRVFAATCTGCHGSYSQDPTESTYPNVIVRLDVIGTDPSLVNGASQFADRFIKWWKLSFYGRTSTIEKPFGYIAPPLDGVWATAPYLHNGSVPNLASIIDSSKRPKRWTRRAMSSSDYDKERLGWNIRAVSAEEISKQPEAASSRRIYDTAREGHAATGHTFGDGLTSEDQEALLEYLKTL